MDESNSFRLAVLKIREEGGTFEFKRNEESCMLYVHVELPVPGVVGMSAWATCPVKDETSKESRAEAAVKCFQACKSKLLTMSARDTLEAIDDGDYLKTVGIKW